MHEGAILIAGVGGLGCAWAVAAHQQCADLSDLLLIDADEASFRGSGQAHCLHLDAIGDGSGAAALPNLAAHRLSEGLAAIDSLLDKAELLFIMTGLGGGTGSGAASELARIARARNCIVMSIAGLPFAEQPLRSAIANAALPALEGQSHVCIRVGMERLAWYARARDEDWQSGSGWIQDLVEGLVTTLAKVGKLNLDLMDLRTVVEHQGGATLIVGTGSVVDPLQVVDLARRSPLTEVDVSGAKGCLIQVEGGPDMTLHHLNQLSESLVSTLHHDCQVILGARASDEMVGKLRLVAVVSGLS